VRRPVTSALILLRSRKIGRIVLNAFLSANPKPARMAMAVAVIKGLILMRMARANEAVSSPPTNWIMPVPIRFRNPSTSLMMRETSAPVLVAS